MITHFTRTIYPDYRGIFCGNNRDYRGIPVYKVPSYSDTKCVLLLSTDYESIRRYDACQNTLNRPEIFRGVPLGIHNFIAFYISTINAP
jgi:hypothetical protein